MIRPGKAADIVRVRELMREALAKSKYANTALEVDNEAVKNLLTPCVMRHGFKNDGGAFFLVSESNGKVVGFFLGYLTRVYAVGTLLEAQDIYLYQSDEAPKRDAGRMVDQFIAWAEANQKVIEIKFSDSDFIAGHQKQLKRFLTKRGFVASNQAYSRRRSACQD